MPATQTPPDQQAKRQLADGKDAAERQAADAKAAASGAADDLSAQASHALDDARHAAGDAAQQAKGMAAAYYSEAKNQAYQAAGEAKSVARQKIAQATNTGKKKAATEVNTYGAAIAKAAAELEKNDEPTAPVVRAAAEKLQEFGDFLENRDAKDLVDSAERYARRHPEVVLGGMFVIGLGLARFFKSTREPLPARTVQSRGGRSASTGGVDTRFAGPRYDGNYAAGRSIAPARLSNPAPRTGASTGASTGGNSGGKAVTVLEETTTVVPTTPK